MNGVISDTCLTHQICFADRGSHHSQEVMDKGANAMHFQFLLKRGYLFMLPHRKQVLINFLYFWCACVFELYSSTAAVLPLNKGCGHKSLIPS